MNISDQLIEKYSLYAADYIEVPKKDFWSPASHDDYVAALKDLARSGNPSVLYLHIPFCAQMCYFCLCHFRITHDYERVQRYLESLVKEVEMVERVTLETQSFNIREVHLGGGSPTYMRENEFLRLKHWLDTLVDFKNLDEFTIEIDPRAIGRDRLAFYAEQGIDRISFGIQDFDPKVQRAINRFQPPELVENILSSPARKKLKSVNFDLLIGLPHQTNWTVSQTINRVIAMKPDRIALSYMHYNPKVHHHQHTMKKDGPLPDFRARKEMHEKASRWLIEAGYVRTGFEHFALPTDDVAKAVDTGDVKYNSLGATPGRCTNMIGLGVSSYCRITDYHYFQQTYDHVEYAKSIADGKFPIMRGHHMTAQDLVRREIIQTLRSVFRLGIEEINRRYHIELRRMMAREFKILEEMEGDGMVSLRDDEIAITDDGKNFTNVICRVFDSYVRGPDFPDDFFEAQRVEL